MREQCSQVALKFLWINKQDVNKDKRWKNLWPRAPNWSNKQDCTVKSTKEDRGMFQSIGYVPAKSSNKMYKIIIKSIWFKLPTSKYLYCITPPHDDVIKRKHFPRYWLFVIGMNRSPVDSPHKGQWRGASIFSLICASTNDWENNRNAGDLWRHRTHYDTWLHFSHIHLNKMKCKPNSHYGSSPLLNLIKSNKVVVLCFLSQAKCQRNATLPKVFESCKMNYLPGWDNID